MIFHLDRVHGVEEELKMGKWEINGRLRWEIDRWKIVGVMSRIERARLLETKSRKKNTINGTEIAPTLKNKT